MNISFLIIHLGVGVFWINRAAKASYEGKYNPKEKDDAIGRKMALEDRNLLLHELNRLKFTLFPASILMMIFAWGNFTTNINVTSFETSLEKSCMDPKSRDAKNICEKLRDKFQSNFGPADYYEDR